jgi:predicted glycogen debranching enzyme
MNAKPIRRLRVDAPQPADLSFEWLVTNGLGGYGSGLVTAGVSRRFHGLLIASLPAPLGRVLCLSHLDVTAHTPGGTTTLDALARPTGDAGRARLAEFRLDGGLPVWRYESAEFVIEKRVVMPYGENTAYAMFRLLDQRAPVLLRFRPLFSVRPHEGRVDVTPLPSFQLLAREDGAEILPESGPRSIQWRAQGLRVWCEFNRPETVPVSYAVEAARGYDHTGDVWATGSLAAELDQETPASFAVSVEGWDALGASSAADVLAKEESRRCALLEAAGDPDDPFVAELTLAADQFIIAPVGRAAEVARARAAGDEPRSVIAGFHWFTDWGRDTMISLEGLTLCTGRTVEAGCILRTFAHYVRDGLIPNMFPEGENRGLYHTADATLWFFHALHRYVRTTGDRATLTALLPTLVGIAERHVAGTHFGIGVDPVDGLLQQGADGYQLTWMDAKVDGWVVTPRRGKAVEINALWVNALRLLADWLEASGQADAAARWTATANQATESFNRRFWNDRTGHLFDVVDGEHGDDPACRPNQLFAVSLDYPVLRPDRWRPVFDVVTSELLTPLGLRSLSPSHPDFRPTYHGDVRTRDAAYHQGTVWAWLIGPYLDAWQRVNPDRHAEARALLTAFAGETASFGVGSISEIFDALKPHTARGCIAQAWSVAEVLRGWKGTTMPLISERTRE